MSTNRRTVNIEKTEPIDNKLLDTVVGKENVCRSLVLV